MNILLISLIGLLSVSAASAQTAATNIECYAYEIIGLVGTSKRFDTYVPFLSDYSFDNTICSARVTGFWIFYDLQEYNDGFSTALGMYMYGVQNADVTFASEDMCDQASSLKYAGNRNAYNEDSLTVYYEVNFGGLYETYMTDDTSDFSVGGKPYNIVKSFVITGTSTWTLYTGTNYGGLSECYTPDLVADGASGLADMNFGFETDLSSTGVSDTFKSAKKNTGACPTTCKVAKNPAAKKTVVHKTKNGGWGLF